MTDNIQSIFLDQIRKKLKSNESLADELAEILNISRDSAYRRIRGETVLSLDEAKLLCIRYGVSLDNLITGTGDMVSFHCRAVDSRNFTIEKWLKSLAGNLETLRKFRDHLLICCAKDLGPCYYLNSPLLGPFKMFFWMSSFWTYENLQGVRFSPDLVSKELIDSGKKVWMLYTDTPRIEIWSDETFFVTLRQIEFYHECGFFADPAYAVQLCEEFLSIVKELRDWATIGYKDKPHQPIQSLYE